MAFNNRNRSLLSLVHHTDRDLLYLLDLSRDLKRAKYSGVGRKSLDGQEHRPDLREDLHPHPLRVRGGGLRRGRPRHLHRPRVVADRPQGVDEGHRAGAGPDVRRDRVPRRRPGDRRGARGVRRRARVQRADRRIPPDADARRRPHHDRTLPEAVARHRFCVRRGRPQQRGQLAAAGRREARHGRADRRTRRPVAQRRTPSTMCREFAAASGARITITDDPVKAVSGVDFIYTDVWVSMGEPLETWGERVELLLPFQVNPELMAAAGNPRVKFMHCLPAFHNSETKVGAQIAAQYPQSRQRRRGHRGRLRELRPTSRSTRPRIECTPSRRSSWPRSAESRPHADRHRAWAAMRCCSAGQPMTADNQRANIRAAAESIAASRRATRSSSRTATARRWDCWRCRPRRTTTSRRTPSMCSGHRPRR